ncbi:AraC family transcriptional regulator [Nocardiopsis sp. N85]|uniref:AraC family transcriptional regulator n=1 Tax=Nocardiopsis sp. N85 TaxID=3029400 RepID=UPI00237FB047|nr:AraC family transcriptional regulator [Nocardiopsis sp. N85]MDE3722246.1 AraC family transcriptional regulator [Nocardiopsis sp. N85]
MDALADLLDGIRARGALFSRSIMEPPWSLCFDHSLPLSLITMVRGRSWIVPERGEPIALAVGDIAVLRGPAVHTVANPADAATTGTVLSGLGCVGPDGARLNEDIVLGVRTYGHSLDAPDLLLSGSYDVTGEVGRRLLSALPEVLVVPADACHDPLTEMIVNEVSCQVPGQQVVLDRLLDLALVTTLRTWFDRPEADPPAWYTALGDPVVGAALRAMHNRPDAAWTVAGLAEACGVSRATLARDFTALLGTPPMTYLTEWRITLAADLLRDTEETVGAIARRVGYADAFALSAAFKRVRGLTPTAHRRGGSIREVQAAHL